MKLYRAIREDELEDGYLISNQIKKPLLLKSRLISHVSTPKHMESTKRDYISTSKCLNILANYILRFEKEKYDTFSCAGFAMIELDDTLIDKIITEKDILNLANFDSMVEEDIQQIFVDISRKSTLDRMGIKSHNRTYRFGIGGQEVLIYSKIPIKYTYISNQDMLKILNVINNIMRRDSYSENYPIRSKDKLPSLCELVKIEIKCQKIKFKSIDADSAINIIMDVLPVSNEFAVGWCWNAFQNSIDRNKKIRKSDVELCSSCTRYSNIL